MSVTIYHNSNCSTSRNVLTMIENHGVEHKVIHYLDTPPTRDELVALIAAMGIAPRALLRENGTPYAELGLDDDSLSDEVLIDAMIAHPILIQRPIVVGRKKTILCRPSERVLEVL